MDIARPDVARRKKQRRLTLAVVGAAAVLGVSVAVAQLKPAAPVVPRASVWIDTVKRGPMVRQVRGLGTLVPEEIRWIAAATEGRVERIVTQPGTAVAADTVLLELSNPELEQAALEATSRLRAAEAAYNEMKVRLESQHLDQQASAARVQAEYSQARLRAEADEQLGREGLVADLTQKLSRNTAEELKQRQEIEQRRLAIAKDAHAAQLLVQAAEVEQRRAMAQLRRSQREALRVRPGLAGVLQQVSVEVGQRVAPGASLARVAQPERLKAVVRVPETQARDVQIGQVASVDTRNGLVAGRVVRIDPSVQNATVGVDIALDGALPRGARPDLSVDATIELERLADVLYVGRPAQGQPEGRITLFRMDPDGTHATRVNVRLGRASVNAVEILEGLQAGDHVVLSDTSAWDNADRIQVK